MRLAARAEQEIRAHPRLHSAFYAAVTRNPRVRELVGRAKDRVRASSDGPAHLLEVPEEEPVVLARRHLGVAARLGLPPEGAG